MRYVRGSISVAALLALGLLAGCGQQRREVSEAASESSPSARMGQAESQADAGTAPRIEIESRYVNPSGETGAGGPEAATADAPASMPAAAADLRDYDSFRSRTIAGENEQVSPVAGAQPPQSGSAPPIGGISSFQAKLSDGVEAQPAAESSPMSPSLNAPSPMAAARGGLQREAGLIAEPQPPHNTEAYDHIPETPFITAADKPLSTFSIDVDTASYANVRRFLTAEQLPPAGAVRIEELVNYFPYDYAPPADDTPFAVAVEIAGCPWNTAHRLARIGLKGRTIELEKRPLSNLVFLLDVSGSMQSPDKLPLVKDAMRMLLDQLGENDRIAIVVYASATGLVLPATPGDQRQVILSAIDNLAAGGSTNGGDGIRLAYNVATQNFIKGGTNRVILCTDGDFNVGTTSQSELVSLIENKAKSGVFLSVLGFGTGNLKDSTMESLADKGNGNYAYIDTESEAKKVLVEQMSGTLITIAKDVKIQVDFNPARVASYRLIGYENRRLADRDFQDDTKDAGEIGAGHAVTALYELVPPGAPAAGGAVEASKYQKTPDLSAAADSDELFTVRLRYKLPDADTSVPFDVPATDAGGAFDAASDDFQFAAAVAQFGLLLTKSQNAPGANWNATKEIAAGAVGEDKQGYRKEFVTLVEKAQSLAGPVEQAQR